MNFVPEARTPIVCPEPSSLSGGHADAPSDLIVSSEAVHLGSAEVSNLVPGAKRSLISLMSFGTPFGAPGSLHAMRVLKPVEAPGCLER